MSKLSCSLSVKVIVHDREGKVLLLRRSKASRNNSGKWEFPGGKVEPGENFAGALIREVREETGLAVELKGSFGTCEAKRAKPPVIYLVMEAESKTHDVTRSSEHDKHEWVNPGDFDDFPISPQFRRIARLYEQEARIWPRGKAPKSQKKPEASRYEGWGVTPQALLKHLGRFQRTHSLRVSLAKWMVQFLRRGICPDYPLADIGARAKDAVSFAGKLIKKKKYSDPLHEVTDLVGARVNLHFQEEVKSVCRWIEDRFEVDRANSCDMLQLLGTDRFGYRAVHYVVHLRSRKPLGLPRRFVGQKVEIQVRTIAQHAWADIGHDGVYKADCDIPYWQREANRIAAMLEGVDAAFAHLAKGISLYRNHVRHSADEASARHHIALWDAVSRRLVNDPRPVLRIVQHAREVQDWRKICRAVNRYKGESNTTLMCAKGYALCKMALNSRSPEWRKGIQLLKAASASGPGSIEAHLFLGELLAPIRLVSALESYEKAFAIDPTNPTAISGYIRCKMLREKSAGFIALLGPDIECAMERCRELAAAGADLPDALYRMGTLSLLRNPANDRQSLDLYARAVHSTVLSQVPLVQALRDTSQLAVLMTNRPDVECARRFLAAALRAKFPRFGWPAGVKKPPVRALRPRSNRCPVVIVAGACDSNHKTTPTGYEQILRDALRDYTGMIISGGTREGISGLIGDIAHHSRGRIMTIGYVPRWPVRGGTATLNDRFRQYGEIRKTDEPTSERFSSRQPIQCWLDLIAAGIHPNQVRLLGINGGEIAGLEYRIAVALGARVGIIEGSGREADRVLSDWPAKSIEFRAVAPHNSESRGGERGCVLSGQLIPLPPDPATIRAFLSLGNASQRALSGEAVEAAARRVHQDFLDQQRYGHSDPAMQPWPRLRADLRDSNRSQVEYLTSILRVCGFGVRKFRIAARDPEFTEKEITIMGELEHGRWNAERLHGGWRYSSKKDAVAKKSPHIVSWSKLPEDVRRWDYANVRLWPEILAELGYEIIRVAGRGRPGTTR